MKLRFLIFLMVLLTACQSSPIRRYEAVTKHPEWSQQISDMVNAGYVVKGMNAEQVIATWGKPCKNCTGTIENTSFEYPTQIIFFDKQGKVSHWVAK